MKNLFRIVVVIFAVCIILCVILVNSGDTNTKSNTTQTTHYSAQKNRVKFKRTVRCRTCGAEISPNAQVCPHCGEKPLGVAVGEGIAEILKGIVLFPFILILVAIAIGFYIGLLSL